MAPYSRQSLTVLHSFASKTPLPARPNHLWQIEQGIVRTLTWNPEGYVTTLGLWGRGEVVGLPLTPLRVYEMECLTPVVVTELTSDQALHFRADLILNHLWRSQELFNIVQNPTLPNRLLNLLYWLGDRFGQRLSAGLLLPPLLTHQQMAEMVGMCRVSVTRLLSQLERQGKLRRLRSPEENWLAELNPPVCWAGSSRTILLPTPVGRGQERSR